MKEFFVTFFAALLVLILTAFAGFCFYMAVTTRDAPPTRGKLPLCTETVR